MDSSIHCRSPSTHALDDLDIHDRAFVSNTAAALRYECPPTCSHPAARRSHAVFFAGEPGLVIIRLFRSLFAFIVLTPICSLPLTAGRSCELIFAIRYLHVGLLGVSDSLETRGSCDGGQIGSMQTAARCPKDSLRAARAGPGARILRGRSHIRDPAYNAALESAERDIRGRDGHAGPAIAVRIIQVAALARSPRVTSRTRDAYLGE